MTSETHGARRSTEQLDLRDLIETIPALVLCALADGSAEFANRAWQDYSGRPLQELTGSGWQSTIHPDDIAKFFHESTVALVSGKSIETEARLRRADGQYHWFSIRKTLAVSRSQNSEPSLRTLIACEDIEERKQEESARRYSEERYRIVVETASDAVVSIDESSTILFVNPATSRIFGYDASELIGQPLTTLMPDYMRELHKAGFKRYLDTAERHINWQGTELIALRKNSEEFPVEVSFGELTINGRRLFTGFIRDITERKRAEEKIRQSEMELRQLLDFTPQHVTVLGPDGRRLLPSRARLSRSYS
jgi:PAS domain S-box-containing protein